MWCMKACYLVQESDAVASPSMSLPLESALRQCAIVSRYWSEALPDSSMDSYVLCRSRKRLGGALERAAKRRKRELEKAHGIRYLSICTGSS